MSRFSPPFLIGSHVFSGHKEPSSVPVRIFAAFFTSAMVAINYTNYSPLIATMKAQLHVSSSQIGLFSTLLFLGLAVAYIPAGILCDRVGTRPVLIGSCLLFAAGELLLPLWAQLNWMLACRLLVGIGSGGAFVAGASVAAGLGEHASLGQGLYGGATQVGSALGLLVTPLLLLFTGWQGSFLFWGILSLTTIPLWLLIHDHQPSRNAAPPLLNTALRSRATWTLGLSHLGTFGLGNAIAAWITIYLIDQYGLSLPLAAAIGSCTLLTGMFFRPLGGILLGRGIIAPIPLLRMGTIMGCVGVGFLALPLHFPPFAVLGLTLIAIGATIPYTSVFNTAAQLRTVRKGVAQGFISVISCPTVIIGPPLIGFLRDRTGNFSLAFASIMLFGCIAITASFLAGSAVQHET